MTLRLVHGSLTAAIPVACALVVSTASVSAGQVPVADAVRAADANVATPRTADGKPDITGMWRSTERGGASGRGSTLPDGFQPRADTDGDGDLTSIYPTRRCAPNQGGGCRDNTNQANDYELTFRDDPNRPLYKAEHWDKVQFLDYDTNFSDPLFRCVPYGIPRVGPPSGIYAVPNGMMFLYTGRNHDYRMIPTDGRGHNKDHLPGFWGDAVGRWEGDTFVVETVGRNDTTWIASGIVGRGGGYFHGFELKVIERFRREGNSLRYEVIVDDPEVLLEPWAMNPRTLALDTNPSALFRIAEGTPCENIDEAIAINRIRH